MSTAAEMMIGPDGVQVRAWRRSARQVQAGDWLPEYGAHALAGAYFGRDPQRGTERVWLTLEDGRDVELTRRAKVWLVRTYAAPAWMAQALDDYRAARHAWEALRESGGVVPAGAVAGAAGANVSAYQLEDADFRAAYPPPRLADFIRQAAAGWRMAS